MTVERKQHICGRPTHARFATLGRARVSFLAGTLPGCEPSKDLRRNGSLNYPKLTDHMCNESKKAALVLQSKRPCASNARFNARGASSLKDSSDKGGIEQGLVERDKRLDNCENAKLGPLPSKLLGRSAAHHVFSRRSFQPNSRTALSGRWRIGCIG